MTPSFVWPPVAVLVLGSGHRLLSPLRALHLDVRLCLPLLCVSKDIRLLHNYRPWSRQNTARLIRYYASNQFNRRVVPARFAVAFHNAEVRYFWNAGEIRVATP